MKINWKVRFQNPLWWAQMASAFVMPVLVYFGLSWNDMTTWGALGALFVQAAGNPVVILSVAVSVFNCIVDPTTAGIGDSPRALGYQKPYRGGELR